MCKCHKLKKRILYILCMGLFSVLCLMSCYLPSKSAKRAYATAEVCKPFDAIIVPGIPFKDGNWDTVMKARVIWSWVLYKNGITRNVIYSGSAVYSPYKEAVIMGLYAQKLGIPKEHIFYETRARHSSENVYYSYLIAQQQGFKTLALATDPFQSIMLKSFTSKRFKSPIFHIPFIKDSVAKYNAVHPKIDPSPAYVTGFKSLPETEGFVKRAWGTMGHDINWDQYPDGQVGPL